MPPNQHELRALWQHVMIALALFLPAAFCEPALQATQQKKWTVMIYMCGDNDLESALIKDLNEMEKVGSSDTVNILAQLSRSPFYDTSNGNWTGAKRYFVTRDSFEDPSPDVPPNNTIRSQMVADLGTVNMGTKVALVDFVTWAVRNYPAERYFLILSDHGSGVRPFERRLLRRAIIFSDSFNDYLSNRELKEAFEELRERALSGKPIEIVGYDASEMSMIENAYQIRHAAKYLIASQLSEPNDGYPYDRFLSDLVSNPSIPTEEFLREFVKHYIASYEPGRPTNGAGSSVTIAVYRLGMLQPLVDAINALAVKLRQRLSTHSNLIESIRSSTQSLSELIYRDLYHFCELLIQRFPDELIKAAARNVLGAHGPGEGKALLAEAHRSGFDINVDNAHGIAIYFPSPESFEQGYLKDLDFGIESEWGRFLAARIGVDSLPPSISFLLPNASAAKLPLLRPMLIAEIWDEGCAGLKYASISVNIDGINLSADEFSYDVQSALLKIKPKAPLSFGRHVLTISAEDNFGNRSSESISFEVIPQILHRGVRMISLPMMTASHDPRAVLEDGYVMLARWDNAASSYRIFPVEDELGYASLRPRGVEVSLPPAGVGYFARLKNDITLKHAGEPVDPSQPYDVHLSTQGADVAWHMIGNPFPIPVKLSSILIVDGSTTMTLDEAMVNGIVLSPPFIYLPPGDPFAPGSYATIGVEHELQPFTAIWMAISKDVIVRFMPPVGSAGRRFMDINSPRRMVVKASVGWRIKVTAECSGNRDSVIIGVSPSGRSSHDLLDELKPPPPPNAKVKCYALQKLFGNRVAQYGVSIQPLSSYASWDIIVEAGCGSVSLLWEGVHQVPSSYRLLLIDVDTGRAICMRHHEGFTLACREKPYRLRLVAQSSSNSRALIIGLSAMPVRGGMGLRFTLLSDMTITVYLRAFTGRTIARVLQRRAMRAGAHTLFFNIPKDVTAPVAIVEVLGEDEIGRVTKAACIARLR